MLRYIQKYCDLNKLSLDICAHIGVHTISMVKYSKCVYAFEPNDTTFETLQMNTDNLNVILFKNAVGEKNKLSNFTASEINSHSNLIQEGFKLKDEQILVEQIKIDDLNIEEPVGFIKIDIEGGEIPAFKGMYKLLEKNKPFIVFEDHSGENIKYLINTHNYNIKKINSTNFLAFSN